MKEIKHLIPKVVLLLVCGILALGSVGCGENVKKSSAGAWLDSEGVWNETTEQKDQRMDWWREANFGMFIHWGLYAVPAGSWDGKISRGNGEWIQRREQIPVAEYEKLAKEFNPVQFDAEKWVKIAKDAGMKYIIITAKHHDGFAMYKSNASAYNIVDATPFDRDPLKELADACAKEGIKLGFYYSQNQDWHDPDATMNYWDFKDNIDKSYAEEKGSDNEKWWRRSTFSNYVDRKGVPQVKELLSNYGDVAVMWFDTAWSIPREDALKFRNAIRSMQPDCIISGRIYPIEKEFMGDFVTTGDNSIPKLYKTGDWEIPGTMNRTWGHRTDDHNWKSTKTLIRNLVDVVSRGGNYLLNVGPTKEGVIPDQSVERLAQMGDWMDKNGESIYDADPSPLGEPDWGRITAKHGKLYLHVYDWPQDGKLKVPGFKNKISKVYLLATEKKSNLFNMRLGDEITVMVPSKPLDENVTVVVMEIEGDEVQL